VMTCFIGELYDFVFNGWTIARAFALDHAGIQR